MAELEPASINLKDLRVLRAVLATGSTVRAAHALGTSQSVVSRTLSKIEDNHGVPLFIRNQGRLKPTPEALSLLPIIDETLEKITDMTAAIDAVRTGNSEGSLLKVAVPISVAQGLMPGVIASFLKTEPDASFAVLITSYIEAERAVAHHQADVGLVMLPTEYPGLTTMRIAGSPRVCLIPADHPLAMSAVIRPVDLSDEPLILIGHQGSNRAQVDRAFWQQGVRPKVRVEADSIASACAFAAAGLGITIVSSLTAGGFLGPSLVIRPFEPAIEQEFGLAVATDRTPSRRSQAFIAHLHMFLLDIAQKIAERLKAPPSII